MSLSQRSWMDTPHTHSRMQTQPHPAGKNLLAVLPLLAIVLAFCGACRDSHGHCTKSSALPHEGRADTARNRHGCNGTATPSLKPR
mmetsp:Transcript_45956/g.114265  ORF Transcript_45956/g.114265 Transcript_45956/m.114265 type:complete len:86 (+) Transcript_45956:1188-1445(+)